MRLALNTADALLPGFADPVFDSQRVFRAAMEALARPGTAHETGMSSSASGPAFVPPPLMPATAALCLTLADFETPVWIQPGIEMSQHEALVAWLRFHCGCPIVQDAAAAHFAIMHDLPALLPLDTFNPGTAEYPDRSATLLIQVPHFASGAGVALRGPGIRDSARMDISGLPAGFWSEWHANHALFPCGVDLIFCSGDRITGLPRTTKVEEAPCT
jgi:alpha-D-ribose 1-methylphosphonate 5-triphosphate synthase subunit PhnH